MSTYFISNNLKEVEIIKTLAKYDANNFNYHFYKPIDLANDILIENNIINSKRIISLEEQYIFYFNIIQEHLDFFKLSKTFDDAIKLCDSINLVRKCCNSYDETKFILDHFKGSLKEDTIAKMYLKYREYLNLNNLTDDILIIRSILNKDIIFNHEVNYFDEFKLSPLDLELIKKCQNNKKIKFKDIFVKNNKNYNLDIYKCYGYGNEIERILSYVIKNKISFDSVLIVTPDNYNHKDIINRAISYNIPITSSKPHNITLSNAYNFIKTYYDLNLKYSYSIDGFDFFFKSNYFNSSLLKEELFKDSTLSDYSKNSYFNNIIKILGNLKIDGSKEAKNRILNYKNILSDYVDDLKVHQCKNKLEENYIKKALDFNNYKNNDFAKDIIYLDYVEYINDQLSKGLIYFLDKYCVKETSDQGIIDNLTQYLNLFSNFSFNDTKNNFKISKELIFSLLNKIRNGSNNSKEGHIHVSTISKAFNCIRDNVFYINLDYTVPKIFNEDYLISDEKLLNICEKVNNDSLIPISTNLTKENKKMYLNLLEILEKLGCNIQLSYSCYNETEIRETNQSSILLEIFAQEHNTNNLKDFSKYLDNNYYGFEDSLISIDSKLIELSKDNIILKRRYNNNSINYYPYKIDLTASKLAKTDCFLKFYLSTLLKLDKFENQKPDEIILATDKGNMVHSLGEYLISFRPNKEEYINHATLISNIFLAGHYSKNIYQKEKLIKDFNRYASNLYDDYHGLENCDVEGELPKMGFVHTTTDKNSPYYGKSIIISGRYDRLDKIRTNSDGIDIYNIVDYKSNASKFKTENNYLETYLYSYIFDKYNENARIYENIYVFTSLNNSLIKLNYQENKNQIIGALNKIIECNVDGVWPINKTKDSCMYCQFERICTLLGGNKDESE